MFLLRSILVALLALIAVPALAAEAQPFKIGDEIIARIPAAGTTNYLASPG